MGHSYGHKLHAANLPPVLPAARHGIPFPIAGLDDLPRGWRRVGFLYFATPHPVYPFPPALVSAIRAQVDPLFVPLWVRTVYTSPSDDSHYFDNMVIAQGVRYPLAPAHRDLRNLPLPPSQRLPVFPHDPLRVMECPEPKDGGCRRPVRGVPGHTLPMDWGLLYHMQAMLAALRELEAAAHGDRDTLVEGQARAFEQSPVGPRGRDRSMVALQSEVDYRWDQHWDHMRRNAEKLDVDDHKRIAAGALAPPA